MSMLMGSIAVCMAVLGANPKAPQPRLTIKVHEDVVNSVAFSPDGKQLASASDDDTVRIVDPKTGKIAATFELPIHVTAAFVFDNSVYLKGIDYERMGMIDPPDEWVRVDGNTFAVEKNPALPTGELVPVPIVDGYDTLRQ